MSRPETSTPITDPSTPDSKKVFDLGFEADFASKQAAATHGTTLPEDGSKYPSTANNVPLVEQPIELEPYWHQPSEDPAEARGVAPTELVGQLAVVPDALVISGLRAKIANRRANKAEVNAEKASAKARYRRGAYRRIIGGEEFPFDNSMDDMLPHTPLDKLDRLARTARHPSRTPQPSDVYGSITSWWESRLNRKQLNRRAKRRMHEMEAEITLKRHGKPLETRENNRDFSVAPSLETYDLDTEQGWRRLYSRPVSGLEVRGHRRAIERVHHAGHVAHSINERAERPVNRAERKAVKRHEKATTLRNRVELIANREDRVNKVYDSGKRKSKAYVKSRVNEIKKDWDTSMAGYKAAPAAFREGQQGINVPDTRTQRAIDKAAHRAGKIAGGVKRSKPSNVKATLKRGVDSLQVRRASRAQEKASRPTREERKQTRKQQKEDYKRQNQNGGVV